MLLQVSVLFLRKYIILIVSVQQMLQKIYFLVTNSQVILYMLPHTWKTLPNWMHKIYFLVFINTPTKNMQLQTGLCSEFLQNMHNWLEVTVISKQVLLAKRRILHSISKYCKKHLLGVWNCPLLKSHLWREWITFIPVKTWLNLHIKICFQSLLKSYAQVL